VLLGEEAADDDDDEYKLESVEPYEEEDEEEEEAEEQEDEEDDEDAILFEKPRTRREPARRGLGKPPLNSQNLGKGKGKGKGVLDEHADTEMDDAQPLVMGDIDVDAEGEDE
jgi:histone acetyltransferase SAS3